MAAFDDFIKKNAGEAIAAGGAIAEIASSKDKLAETFRILKDFALWKVTWPSALLGTLNGISTAVRSVARESGALGAAFNSLSRVRFYAAQFEPLLKSAAAARSRIAELMQFEKRSPFNLGQIVAASRALEIYSNGALRSATSLKLVEGIAKSSGESISDAADAYGEFYRGLKNGAPVREAASALQAMGVINEQTIDHLERMQESGASWTQVVEAATDSIRGLTGGTDDFSKSMEGLQKQLDDASEKMKASFGKPFMDAERRSMEASIEVAKRLAPVMEALGKPFAGIAASGSDATNAIKTRLAAAVGSPAGQAVAGLAGNAASTLTTALSALAGISLVKNVPTFLRGAGNAQNFVAGGLSRASGSVGAYVQTLEATLAAGGTLTPLQRAAAGPLGATERALAGAAGVARAPIAAAGRAARGAFGAVSGVFPMGAVGIGATGAAAAVAVAIEELGDQIDKQSDKMHNLHDAYVAVNEQLDAQIKTAENSEDAYKAAASANSALADAVQRLASAKPPSWWDRFLGAISGGTTVDEVEGASAQVAGLRARKARADRVADSGLVGRGEQDAIRQEAARNLRYSDLTAQNQIELATGQNRIDLLQKQRQTFAERGTTADDYLKAKADYDEQVAKITAGKGPFAGALSEQSQLNIASAGVQNPLLREGLGLEAQRQNLEAQRGKMSPEQFASAQQDYLKKFSAYQARLDDITKNDYTSRAKSLEPQIALAQREYTLAVQRAKVEQSIAESKKRGVELEEEAARKTREQLRRELALPQNAGPAEQAALKAQIAESERQSRERARASAVDQLGAGRALQESQLRLRGDARGIQRLGDLDRFAENLERARAIFSDPKKAEDYARQLTQNEVAIDQRNAGLSFTSSIAASSLAKIGGGGNVADAQSPLVDLTQRQVDLTEQIKNYLAEIAARKGAVLK